MELVVIHSWVFMTDKKGRKKEDRNEEIKEGIKVEKTKKESQKQRNKERKVSTLLKRLKKGLNIRSGGFILEIWRLSNIIWERQFVL